MTPHEDYAGLGAQVDWLGDLDLVDPLAGWLPTPPGLAWMRLSGRKKLLRGPNQASKTESGGAELLCRMRGTHPYIKTHRVPIQAWVVCASWKQSLIIQRKIWDLLAKGELAESSKYTNKNGFTGAYFELKNGSTCQIVTANQDTLDLASASLHYIWCDEPPPEAIWNELLARLTHHRGTLAVTMTPVGRPVEFLKEKVEAGEIEEVHFTLTVENCTPVGSVVPFRSEEAIAEFRTDCLPQERAQRCDGAWEGVAEGRIFEAWSEDLLSDVPPPGTVQIGIGIDHGAKAGRQCAVLVAVAMVDVDAGRKGSKTRQRPAAWVLDEARSDGRTGSEEDARHILDMLARHGLTLADVDFWKGDRAHGGDWRGNQKSNRDLKRAFSLLTDMPVYKLPEPLQRISVPKKWSGSVAYGCRLMNKLMAAGLFTISPEAEAVLDGIRNWEGLAQDPKKDPVDAARYIIEAMIDARHIWGSHSPFAAVA